MLLINVLAGVSLSAAPAPIHAQDTAVAHYVQCFVATSTLAESEDPAIKFAGLLAANFYAGHIFGKTPDIDLTAALRREAPLLGDARIRSLLVECGAEMEARGKQITAAGQAVEDEARRDGPTS